MKRPPLLRAMARAMSLFEVIVAASLLAVGSMSTMAVMSSAMSAGAQTRKTNKAALLMDALLERYRGVGEAKLLDQGANRYLARPLTQFREYTLASGSTMESFTIEGLVGGGLPELKGATVTTEILSELEAAESFFIDLDGDGQPDPVSFDGDGPENSNVAEYNLVPLRIVIAYDGIELVGHTIVYPTTSD